MTGEGEKEKKMLVPLLEQRATHRPSFRLPGEN